MTLQELYEATKQDLENGYDPDTLVVVNYEDSDGYDITKDAVECYWLRGKYWIGVR